MITFFAIPKPFTGHIGVIQRNAIKSWTMLRPSCDIILFGDEDGTAMICNELGLKHHSDVARNEFGTPLLDYMFEKAQALSKNDIICFINADIILMHDFIDSVKRVSTRKKSFLLVGQRWDIDITDPIDFNTGWENELKIKIRHNGQLHPPAGSDYFVFKKGMWGSIPPFAIGRPGYDNWLIYRARSLNIPAIDGTRTVTAVHQNHDYSHLKDVENRLGNGPEVQYNLKLMGDNTRYVLKDANWVLTNRFLLPSFFKKILW